LLLLFRHLASFQGIGSPTVVVPVVTVVVAVPVVGTMVAEATGTWGRVVAMETWPQVALEIRILNVVGRMGEIDCSQQTDKCITILAGVVVFYHMHDASPMFNK